MDSPKSGSKQAKITSWYQINKTATPSSQRKPSSHPCEDLKKLIPENLDENKSGFPVKFSHFRAYTNLNAVAIDAIKSRRSRGYQPEKEIVQSQEYILYKEFYESKISRKVSPVRFIRLKDDYPEENRDLIPCLKLSERYEFPVPLAIFCKYTDYEKAVEALLKRNARKKGKTLSNIDKTSDEWQSSVQKIYERFYTCELLRHKYAIKVKACPKKIKDKILSFALVVKNNNNEDIAPDEIQQNSNSIEIEKSKDETTSNPEMSISPIEKLPTNYNVFLEHTNVKQLAKEYLNSKEGYPATECEVLELTKSLYRDFRTKPWRDIPALKELFVRLDYVPLIMSFNNKNRLSSLLLNEAAPCNRTNSEMLKEAETPKIYNQPNELCLNDQNRDEEEPQHDISTSSTLHTQIDCNISSPKKRDAIMETDNIGRIWEFPVSFEKFCKYTHYEKIVEEKISREHHSTGEKNSMWEKEAREVYINFYTSPRKRQSYEIQLKAIPKKARGSLLEFAKLSKNTKVIPSKECIKYTILGNDPKENSRDIREILSPESICSHSKESVAVKEKRLIEINYHSTLKTSDRVEREIANLINDRTTSLPENIEKEPVVSAVPIQPVKINQESQPVRAVDKVSVVNEKNSDERQIPEKVIPKKRQLFSDTDKLRDEILRLSVATYKSNRKESEFCVPHSPSQITITPYNLPIEVISTTSSSCKSSKSKLISSLEEPTASDNVHNDLSPTAIHKSPTEAVSITSGTVKRHQPSTSQAPIAPNNLPIEMISMTSSSCESSKSKLIFSLEEPTASDNVHNDLSPTAIRKSPIEAVSITSGSVKRHQISTSQTPIAPNIVQNEVISIISSSCESSKSQLIFSPEEPTASDNVHNDLSPTAISKSPIEAVSITSGSVKRHQTSTSQMPIAPKIVQNEASKATISNTQTPTVSHNIHPKKTQVTTSQSSTEVINSVSSSGESIEPHHHSTSIVPIALSVHHNETIQITVSGSSTTTNLSSSGDSIKPNQKVSNHAFVHRHSMPESAPILSPIQTQSLLQPSNYTIINDLDMNTFTENYVNMPSTQTQLGLLSSTETPSDTPNDPLSLSPKINVGDVANENPDSQTMVKSEDQSITGFPLKNLKFNETIGGFNVVETDDSLIDVDVASKDNSFTDLYAQMKILLNQRVTNDTLSLPSSQDIGESESQTVQSFSSCENAEGQKCLTPTPPTATSSDLAAEKENPPSPQTSVMIDHPNVTLRKPMKRKVVPIHFELKKAPVACPSAKIKSKVAIDPVPQKQHEYRPLELHFVRQKNAGNTNKK